MAANSIELNSITNDFEREVFDTLARELSDEYTVISSFTVPGQGREIDGLVIGPNSIFTIEAKGMKGHVEKGANTPTTITVEEVVVSLDDRAEDPYTQAEKQPKFLLSFLQNTFGLEGRNKIWVKSLLIFGAGSTFDVPPETRNVGHALISPFIVELDEAVSFIKDFSPPGKSNLTREVHDVLVKAIRLGPDRLGKHEKDLVKKNAGDQPAFSVLNWLSKMNRNKGKVGVEIPEHLPSSIKRMITILYGTMLVFMGIGILGLLLGWVGSINNPAGFDESRTIMAFVGIGGAIFWGFLTNIIVFFAAVLTRPDRVRKVGAGKRKRAERKGLQKVSLKNKWVVIVIAALFISIAYLSGIFLPRGCVTANTLNVREAPSGRVVGDVSQGDCFRFDARTTDGYWVRISGLSLKRGDWVSSGYIQGIDIMNLKQADPR